MGECERVVGGALGQINARKYGVWQVFVLPCYRSLTPICSDLEPAVSDSGEGWRLIVCVPRDLGRKKGELRVVRLGRKRRRERRR